MNLTKIYPCTAHTPTHSPTHARLSLPVNPNPNPSQWYNTGWDYMILLLHICLVSRKGNNLRYILFSIFHFVDFKGQLSKLPEQIFQKINLVTEIVETTFLVTKKSGNRRSFLCNLSHFQAWANNNNFPTRQ